MPFEKLKRGESLNENRTDKELLFNSWAKNFKDYQYKEHNKKDQSLNHLSDENEIVAELDRYGKIIIRVFKKLTKDAELEKEEREIFTNVKLFALNTLSKLNGKTATHILDNAYDIGFKKNHDYGSDNILNFGIFGVLVRLNDKIQRAKNLISSGNGIYKVKSLAGNNSVMVKDEKVEDTIFDMINYSTYGNMLLDEVWF